MDISRMYNIDELIRSLEVALQIDGSDYAERNVDTIIRNIKNRIIRQYQVDLTLVKMNDDALYMGKSRAQAMLFLENITMLHANLCGYLQTVRFNGNFVIKPSNVNYLGVTEKPLMNFLQLCMRGKTVPSIAASMDAIKHKVSNISTCLEKKIFLLLVVSYELGFYELLATLAEIMYLGGRLEKGVIY